MALDIRRAASDDAPHVAALSRVLGYPVDPAIISERLAHLTARDAEAVFVAVDRDRIVGWIHGSERELLEVGRQVEILGLVVDLTATRSGAGRALVDAVERWAAS